MSRARRKVRCGHPHRRRLSRRRLLAHCHAAKSTPLRRLRSTPIYRLLPQAAERVLSGVFLDGARFFFFISGFAVFGLVGSAGFPAGWCRLQGVPGRARPRVSWLPWLRPPRWLFLARCGTTRNLAVWPEFLCFGIRPVFVCFGRYSRACGSLERAPWGVLSDGVGVPGRRDRSCRSVFRPASAPLGFGLFPAPDASIRALRVLTPPSRMFRAALASALSVCPQLRHWKFAWLSRFFRVGRALRFLPLPDHGERGGERSPRRGYGAV